MVAWALGDPHHLVWLFQLILPSTHQANSNDTVKVSALTLISKGQSLKSSQVLGERGLLIRGTAEGCRTLSLPLLSKAP